MKDKTNWLKVTYDESDNTKLKDLYVGWSEVYDEEMVEGGYAYPKYIKSIFPNVGIAKDAKIVDAGCGSGWPGQTLADIGYTNLHGLDYSPEMLVEAKKKNIYTTLTEANLKEPIPKHVTNK